MQNVNDHKLINNNIYLSIKLSFIYPFSKSRHCLNFICKSLFKLIKKYKLYR